MLLCCKKLCDVTAAPVLTGMDYVVESAYPVEAKPEVSVAASRFDFFNYAGGRGCVRKDRNRT